MITQDYVNDLVARIRAIRIAYEGLTAPSPDIYNAYAMLKSVYKMYVDHADAPALGILEGAISSIENLMEGQPGGKGIFRG